MQDLFRDFLALFFPNYCLRCQQVLLHQETWLCTTCFTDLPQTQYHLDVNNPVAQKLYSSIPVTHAMALYQFRSGSAVQHLIYHFKYNHKPAIGDMLGRIYGALLIQSFGRSPFDCIVPVPLHKDRLLQRGYNQSDYFAKGMAALLAIPWHNRTITRIKNTPTQTKKNKVERLQNLMGAFVVIDPLPIQNKHVLLVDDVITTGATLEACALPLLSAGANKISIATIGVAM